MDGLATNIKMCRLLGCQLEYSSLKTYFNINEKNIYVIFDACHMQKLMRNMIADYGVIYDENNNISR